MMLRLNGSRIMVALLAILLVGCQASPTTPKAESPRPAPPSPELTVMSYNIHHGEGMDGVFDLPRIAAVIMAANPDLVALQEVDNKTTRASGVDQAAELAQLTGMYYVFGNAIDFAGGEYGEAILSRFPILESMNYHLPFTEGHERRSALAVTVQPSQFNQPIQFVGTHWAHDREDDRVTQAQQTDALFGVSNPDIAFTLLAGDLNAEPGSAPLAALAANWRSLNAATRFGAPRTYPADDPAKAIDHLYLTPQTYDAFVVNITVIDERIASDHRPLVVRIFCKDLQVVEAAAVGMSK